MEAPRHIDYEDRANELVELSHSMHDNIENRMRCLAEAQVFATLHLADEVRKLREAR